MWLLACELGKEQDGFFIYIYIFHFFFWGLWQQLEHRRGDNKEDCFRIWKGSPLHVPLPNLLMRASQLSCDVHKLSECPVPGFIVAHELTIDDDRHQDVKIPDQTHVISPRIFLTTSPWIERSPNDIHTCPGRECHSTRI